MAGVGMFQVCVTVDRPAVSDNRALDRMWRESGA